MGYLLIVRPLRPRSSHPLLLFFSRAFGFAFGGIQAARALHSRLLGRVLGKAMTFFDVTPSGRVVNRFSRDAFSVDDPLPFHLNVLLAQVQRASCG